MVEAINLDNPEVRKAASANFTRALFYIYVEDCKEGGMLMKAVKGLVAKEIDVLEKFKAYNENKIEEHRKDNTEYAKGYIAALNEQNSILDKQIKILKQWGGELWKLTTVWRK